AGELVPHDVAFAADHRADPLQELRHRGPGPPAVVGLRAGAEAPHRLTERLGGDRARLDADAAHAPLLLDHRDVLADLGRLHGRALPRRTAADADEVVVRR